MLNNIFKCCFPSKETNSISNSDIALIYARASFNKVKNEKECLGQKDCNEVTSTRIEVEQNKNLNEVDSHKWGKTEPARCDKSLKKHKLQKSQPNPHFDRDDEYFRNQSLSIKQQSRLNRTSDKCMSRNKDIQHLSDKPGSVQFIKELQNISKVIQIYNARYLYLNLKLQPNHALSRKRKMSFTRSFY